MAAARSRARTDEASAKPRPDAYVGLLGLSLLALSAAMFFAYLNWDSIKEKPKQVPTSPPGGGARMPAAAPTPNVGVPQGQVQPGNAPALPGPPGVNPPPQTK
ncbi:MAG TPA: hypothetical protein VMF69_25310 [Gemmataceae bacterium]|nr:hypothetical protein [Gemmataceae bacterium]